MQSINNSVKTFAQLLSTLVISTLLVGQAVFAVPFSYEYNDTIGFATIPGLTAGQSAKITVTLDNGGATRNSQTWTSAHLKAVTFNFNTGTVVTTFCTPFGGGLRSDTEGNFVSNGSGNLTDVMTRWNDDSLGADFTTNSTRTPNAWHLDGTNGVYYENNWALEAKLTNNVTTTSMTTASNWTTSALIGSCTPPPPVSAPIIGLKMNKIEIFATEVELK